MNFDFYQQYKDYPNTELLKIVRRPSDYQPAAVAVASELLSKRQITPEDLQIVDEYFQQIEDGIKAKKEMVGALQSKASDFLQPVLHPTDKVEPQKWLNILLLVVAIQYLWTLFKTIRRLIVFIECYNCQFGIFDASYLLTLAWISVIFYLLLKQRRWGWILLFADNLFTLILVLTESYWFFKYQRIHHGNTTYFLAEILARIAFVCFLWRPLIASYFTVSNRTKANTALVTASAALLYLLILYMY